MSLIRYMCVRRKFLINRRPIRVLHIITRLIVGGAQDNTLLTTSGLDRTRYEVHLAAAPGGEWWNRACGACDALFPIPNMRLEVSPAHDWRALAQIRRLIHEHKYEIVHTHSSKAGILGRMAARQAQVPVIIHTIHSFAWNDYMSRYKVQLYQLLERYAASFSTALITVSELIRKEAVELKIAPPEKMTTIYSGIDLSRFDLDIDVGQKRLSLGLNPNGPVVGMVARLAQQKAPLDFVQAAQHVLQRKPSVEFLIVGDGPLRGEVQKAIAGAPRIHLLGARHDVPEILAAIDIFALSSLWEGLGRALTEAMIMARPVAVTAVNGVPEVVKHWKTGLLSPPGAPEKLADNIVRLLENPVEACQMGQRAHDHVIKICGADKMVADIDALYQRLLRGVNTMARNQVGA